MTCSIRLSRIMYTRLSPTWATYALPVSTSRVTAVVPIPWYSGCSRAFSKILRPARRIAWVSLVRVTSTGSVASPTAVGSPSIELTISSTVFTAMALAYSPPA